MPNRPTDSNQIGNVPINDIPDSDIPKSNNLAAAIHSLNMSLAGLPSGIARAVAATGKIAGEAGHKVHEQVYYGKKEHVGRVGAIFGGPIGAAIGESLTDSQTIKDIKESIKNSIKTSTKRALSSLKTPVQEAAEPEAKPAFKKIPKSSVSSSNLWTKSPDLVDAIDRLRISNVAVLRQMQTMSESQLRKKEIPKAAKGGIVRKTGKAIVHAGEVIAPKTDVEKQTALLYEIQKLNQQQLGSLDSLKLALTDEEGAGGFFKTFGIVKDLMPVFSGGMYKNDIQRSTNPFVSMTSALVEIYRWQRLYGELSKRQLNQLIKIGGGETQEVYGKRGVFAEYLQKKRFELLQSLSDFIDKQEGEGKTAGLAKSLRWGLGSLVGDIISQDMEQFTMRAREATIEAIDRLRQKPEGFLKTAKELSLFGMKKEVTGSGIEKEEVGGKVKYTKHEMTSYGIEKELFPILQTIEDKKAALEEQGKRGSSKFLMNIDKNIEKLLQSIQANAPKLAIGGYVKESGLANIHKGETIIPASVEKNKISERPVDKLVDTLLKSKKGYKNLTLIDEMHEATTTLKSILKIQKDEEGKKKKESIWSKFTPSKKNIFSEIGSIVSGIMKFGSSFVSTLTSIGPALLQLGEIIATAYATYKTLKVVHTDWKLDSERHAADKQSWEVNQFMKKTEGQRQKVSDINKYGKQLKWSGKYKDSKDINTIKSLLFNAKSQTDTDFIKNLVNQGFSSSRIEEIMSTKQTQDEIKNLRKDSEQLAPLIKRYGKDNVIPLYNQLKDVDQVKNLLNMKWFGWNNNNIEKTFGEKYAVLLKNGGPEKKEEILQYMKDNFDPDKAAKILKISDNIKESNIDYTDPKDAAKKLSKNLRKVGDWSGLADSIITKDGTIIRPAKNDIVTAQRSANLSLSGKYKSPKFSIGGNLDLSSSSYNTNDKAIFQQSREIGISGGYRSPRFSVNGRYNNSSSTYEYPRNRRYRENRLTGDLFNDTHSRMSGDLFNDISPSYRRRTISEAQISKNREKTSREIEVQKQMNDAAATIKTAQQLNDSAEKTNKSNLQNTNTMIKNITSVVNNSSNVSGGSGGGSNKLPLWKDIDSILAGNFI